ncbi:MAG: glycosyltransferase [Candidatus Kaiserbacteria bacterium]|nr:glycosyltransferase [Candidatus Kaiserbacteria bacterium]
MRIYVCIPSLNEARTIGSVTKLVDQGLKEFSLSCGESIEAKIINIDSSSEDGTPNVFNSIETFFPKQSIILDEPRGKGRNLLEFIDIAGREDASFCLTMDADIHSADPSWISELLNPIVSGHAGFVTPLYARSRFEGSSTNHFAYPIVLATTGVSVRQPIAGDFAFNSSLLNVVQSLKIPEAARGYGIDIFLSLAALTHGLRHKQVELGEKMHNPSFDKLESMFPQIAAAALSILREVKVEPTVLMNDPVSINNIASIQSFPHKDAAITMRKQALLRINSTDAKQWRWIPPHLLGRKWGDTDIQSDDWIIILSGWIEYGIKNRDVDATLLAEQLLPFFVLRATAFWFASEKMTAEEVENQIRNQAFALRSSLKGKFGV